jgi:hypothetical protein
LLLLLLAFLLVDLHRRRRSSFFVLRRRSRTFGDRVHFYVESLRGGLVVKEVERLFSISKTRRASFKETPKEEDPFFGDFRDSKKEACWRATFS